MASYAASLAEMARLSKKPGLHVRLRKPNTVTSTDAANNLFIRDMRVSSKRVNELTVFAGAPHPGLASNPAANAPTAGMSPGPSGKYGWLQYEVGTATTYPDSAVAFA